MYTKEKQKTIVILFDNVGLGGIQKKITLITSYLKKTTHNISCVLYVRERTKFSFQKDIQKSDATVLYEKKLRYGKRFQDLFYILQLSIIILKKNPTVILHFEYQTLPLLYWTKKILWWKHFRIVIAQETSLTSYQQTLGISQHYPYSFFKKYLTLGDVIITPTDFIKHDLIKRYGQEEKRIIVIPNSIMETKRKQYQKKSIDCIYCGRLAKEKNLSAFIRIIHTVKKRYANIQARIIGEGEEYNMLQRLIQTYHLSSSIKILPPRGDITSYLQRSTLFLLTSTTEGLPFALIEAMNQGVIPVTQYLPELNTYLIHNKNAMVAKNEKHLSAYIYTLLTNPKKRTMLRKHAIQTVMEKNRITHLSRFIEILLQEK